MTADFRAHGLDVDRWGETACRLASRYPLTEAQAASLVMIAGGDERAEEACKAMLHGWEYARVRSCLLYGEVRTCEQMIAWMRAHPGY